MPVNILPREFRGKYPTGAIASYTYDEVIEGTGFKNFYLFGSYTDNTTIVYELNSDNTIWTGATTLAHAGTEATPKLTNFNLGEFKSQKLVSGVAYLSVGMYCKANNSTGSTITGQVTAKLQKVSGGVATDCSSTITGNSLTATQNTTTTMNTSLKIALTETFFKKGDSLRLVLGLNMSANAQAANSMGIGIDPSGAANTLYTNMKTNTMVRVPFRLEL